MDNFFRSRDYGYCRMDNRTKIYSVQEFQAKFPDFTFHEELWNAKNADE